MPKVFVVQKQYRRDRITNDLVPKFDLTAAEEYGELVFLLGPNARPFGNPHELIEELKAGLQGYTEKDYLLLIGNPALICWTACAAVQASGGKHNLLQWNGKAQKYVVISADFS